MLETDPQKKEELNKELIIMFDEVKKALLRMQQLSKKHLDKI